MLLASRLCTPVCRRHRHAPQAFGSAAMLLHDGSSLFVLRVAFVFIALDRSGSSSSLSYSFAYLLHTSHLRRYYCLFVYLSIIFFPFFFAFHPSSRHLFTPTSSSSFTFTAILTTLTTTKTKGPSSPVHPSARATCSVFLTVDRHGSKRMAPGNTAQPKRNPCNPMLLLFRNNRRVLV